MIKIIAENRKSRSDYKILDTFESGIKLKGYEVKAAKSGKINITGSFVIIRNRQAWLVNADIPPYQPANTPVNYDQHRTRNLLLTAKEIANLSGKIKEKNLTILPLKVYIKNGLIKLELGLGRGLRKSDKRELIKKRDVEREVGRRLKN